MKTLRAGLKFLPVVDAVALAMMFLCGPPLVYVGAALFFLSILYAAATMA
jgi:hypothetical protein